MKLTDKALRAACLELADTLAEGAERQAEAQSLPPFSQTFLNEMDGLCQIARKRGRSHKLLQRAAALFLALLLGGLAYLAAVPEARAAVVNWFRELYRSSVVYRFTGTSWDAALPTYEPGWLPEGFELVEAHENLLGKRRLYRSEEGQVVFGYAYMTENFEAVYIGQEELAFDRISIHGMEAHFYPAGNGSQTANLIWFDEERRIVFALDSDLEKSVILHIAENVILAD